MRTEGKSVTSRLGMVALLVVSGWVGFTGRVDASVENGEGPVDFQFRGSGEQEVGGFAATPDGLIIVAGSTDSNFHGAHVAEGEDALLFAFDPSNGNVEWAVTNDGVTETADVTTTANEYFNDVIVHSNGDIYAVGQVDGDGGDTGQAAIYRYAYDGTKKASLILGDDPDTAWDEAQSVVEGPGGMLYVVGYSGNGFVGDSHVIGGYHDAFVAVVDPESMTLGEVFWFGDAGDDRAYSIAVDDSGALYIAGRANSSGVWDWYVAKFAGTGELLWQRFGGDGVDEAGDDRAWDVQYSPIDDSVWFAGYRGSVEYDHDGHPGLLVKDGFAGQLAASSGSDLLSVVNTYADSEFRSVLIDSLGHPIVTWTIDGDNESNVANSGGLLQGGADSGLSHNPGYDPVGYWDGYITTSGDDELVNSFIDDGGNLWLLGTTTGSLARSNDGSVDIFVRRYRESDRSHGAPPKPKNPTWASVSGPDRFSSAIEASKSGPTGGSVILVDGRDDSNVLFASMLDSARPKTEPGRVLYVEPGATAVSESLRSELQRIAPSSLSIVGDERSISPAFLADLTALGLAQPTRFTANDIAAKIIANATRSTPLVLIADDQPTTVLQAVSLSNSIGGVVLPIDAASFALERLGSVGFTSLIAVGNPDPSRSNALSVIESYLGPKAVSVAAPDPSGLSFAAAAVIGQRTDVAVVSPTNWIDAVHANSARLPLVWVGPDCVQQNAMTALSALRPTKSIRGFGGAIATLGDPRKAPHC